MVDIGTEFVYRQMRFMVLSIDDREVGLSGATTDLTGMVDIPSKVRFGQDEYTVVTICGMAFRDADRVRSVNYPKVMTYLMSHAFAHADLDPYFRIPQGMDYVGGYHFAGCKGLKEVTLPPDMTEVPVGMFNDCIDLVTVRFGPCVEVIGDFAFMGCENLASVVTDDCASIDDPDGLVLPDSVCEVGGSAFSDTRFLRIYTDAEVGAVYSDVPEFRRKSDPSDMKRVRSGFTGRR